MDGRARGGRPEEMEGQTESGRKWMRDTAGEEGKRGRGVKMDRYSWCLCLLCVSIAFQGFIYVSQKKLHMTTSYTISFL